MLPLVPNLLAAGLALALLEITWVLLRAHALFLGLADRATFVIASASGMTTCVVALGLLLAKGAGEKRAEQALRYVLAVAAGGTAARLLWLLSDGRRVRELAARPFVIAVLALVIASAAFLALRVLPRLRLRSARARWWLVLACAAGALAALLADALVLPRGYPAFHLGAWLLALVFASYAGALAPYVPSARHVRGAPLLAALLLVLSPLSLSRLAVHPTASFAVSERAPWSARLMSLASPTRRETHVDVGEEARQRNPRTSVGVDLRDRDLLLITVDALRADLLSAYGGRDKTPALDALARESVVFLRAYTPAPHTSYALTSLLTGKFVKPLVELGQRLGDPPTLPDRLRRYGYRTAAFYPPAIFFVDGASFAPLAERGFGFEYRKEMFASAEMRVEQLTTYLAQAEPRPLFAWVHLFEPHEPYDPPDDLAHDGSARGRYEAEVLACDRAIAKLVAAFRAARPNATVIVTADHGEEFGDHGGSFHGSSLYDEQVRVPLLWSSPGAVTPRVTSVPVELVDVGTTILSSAGIPRDPHMRGDDLGAVLRGDDSAGPSVAFSSIDHRHMATNGRDKVICGAGDTHCALFDLVGDPREVHNLAAERAQVAAGLQREIDRFLSSIARKEVVSMSEGVGLPEVLARAKLGVRAPAAELLSLLAHERAIVRAETARVLGEQRVHEALPALLRAQAHDERVEVREEAAIAALLLGSREALEEVLAVLSATDLPRRRRAALALAQEKREESLPVLAELLRDESATESERVRAAEALGELGASGGVEPLIAGLAWVRLRSACATALGKVGGDRAREALGAQLDGERYPPARRAEAEALMALGDPQLVPRVRRFLGMESSLPGGVRLLAELGALAPSTRAGALLSDAGVRTGHWTCGEHGCTPHEGARIVLPRRGPGLRGPVRVVLWYGAAPGAALHVDGVRVPLQAAEEQLSLARDASSSERISLAAEGEVTLHALAIVPATDEIPPPAPEPWDGGAPPLVGP